MADRNRRTPVEHVGDDELLTRVATDDPDAARELYRRSAGGAWGLALAVTGEPVSAGAAVADGFNQTLTSLRDGNLEVGDSFRAHVLAATRSAALESDADLADHVADLAGDYPDDSPVATAAKAFSELPEPSRSALWLADVEMMGDEQLAVALASDDADTADADVRVARDQLRDHLNAALDEPADDECELVGAQLVVDLAGDLDDLGVDALHEHLTGCAACRARRDRLVSATDRLAALVPEPPEPLERDTLNRWRSAVGLSLIHSGRTPIVRTGAKHTAELPAVALDAGAHPFDMPEPASERWLRRLTTPGPVVPTRSRKMLVAAAAAALVLVGAIGAGVYESPSHQVRSALTTDGSVEGHVVVGTTTTLPPVSTSTTIGPLTDGGIDLEALAALAGDGSVLPAGSGKATTGRTHSTTPTTHATTTTAAKKPPATTTTAPPTTRPAPTTTARHCVQWLLGHAPANKLEAAIDPCLKWSS